MSSLIEVLATSIRGADDADGRIPYPIYGHVVDTEDPRALGRVRARLDGQPDHDSSDWLLPIWPGGMEGIPRLGDPVIVWFVNGDPNRGSYAWHPSTRTIERATDFQILGTTFIGLFNALVEKFNTHTHTYIPGGNPATSTSGPSSTATKGANAEGGTVADGTNPVVLSSRVKVMV